MDRIQLSTVPQAVVSLGQLPVALVSDPQNLLDQLIRVRLDDVLVTKLVDHPSQSSCALKH